MSGRGGRACARSAARPARLRAGLRVVQKVCAEIVGLAAGRAIAVWIASGVRSETAFATGWEDHGQAVRNPTVPSR